MEQALRSAMFASPQDQMPRLIYADWLDEQGRFEEGERVRRYAYEKLPYLRYDNGYERKIDFGWEADA